MRGWRYFVLDGTDLDYPIADIACWVVIAEAAALRAGLWEGEHLAQATARLTDYAGDLLLQQAPSGGFVPIPQVEDRHVRTYTTTLAVWLHYAYVLPEEAFLRDRFGAEFEQYARRVPRWVLIADRNG